MSLGRRASARRDESAGLHDPIQRTAIEHEIFYYWERADAKRLDRNCVAVAKLTHVQLTHCAGMIRPVSFAVHGERAGAANPFAAIGVERDGFLAGPEQIFV